MDLKTMQWLTFFFDAFSEKVWADSSGSFQTSWPLSYIYRYMYIYIYVRIGLSERLRTYAGQGDTYVVIW